jgi:uridylate kinase
MPRYKRVMIKLSGGAMAGTAVEGGGHDIFGKESIEHIVEQVAEAVTLGVEVAIMVGGGNIFRGNVAQNWKIERAEADNMGMLGTIINGVMLRAAMAARVKTDVRVMTAIAIDAIAEPYIRLRANRHLDRGLIVILVGGIGQPYVTTDYPAVQRAIETHCEAILAAKHGVDGVFTADPKRDPAAKRYVSVGYDEVIARDLRVMDQSAILLARDHKLPIHLFDFDTPGSIRRICLGEDVGTLISPDVKTTLAS